MFCDCSHLAVVIDKKNVQDHTKNIQAKFSFTFFTYLRESDF
jgi:hypothetical protein